jgi:hypothetical protein
VWFRELLLHDPRACLLKGQLDGLRTRAFQGSSSLQQQQDTLGLSEAKNSRRSTASFSINRTRAQENIHDTYTTHEKNIR